MESQTAAARADCSKAAMAATTIPLLRSDSLGPAPSRGASFCFDLFYFAVSHFFYYVTNYSHTAHKNGSIYCGLREPTYKDALLGLYVLI